MKVKIGHKIYSSLDEPIMIILDKTDKDNIASMPEDNTQYCSYPASGFTPEYISNWMKVYKGKHITEEKRPEQVKAWKDIDEICYQVHLDKNADYSPYNILAMGEVGCLVRIWDKVARLMNLYGIDIGSGKYNPPKDPHVKDESVDDTIMDLRNYAQIFAILKSGKWGK